MTELARFFALFRTEARLHLGHWRFWGSLLLFVALSGDFILKAGDSAQTAIDAAAPARPYLWAFAAILLLSGVEAAAECRRPGLAGLLWTKPFSSISFVCARQAALMCMLMVALAMPFLAHWAWIRLYYGGIYDFEPSIWMLLYGAYPAALLLSSIAIWCRTIFGHHVSALAAAGGLLWVLLTANESLGLGLAGIDSALGEMLFRPVHPSVGSDLFHPIFLSGLGRTAAVCFVFVALSACHLRRIEPRPVQSRQGLGALFPSFKLALGQARFDPGLDRLTAAALAASAIAAAGLCADRAMDTRAQRLREQLWAQAMLETLPPRVDYGPPIRRLDVRADLVFLDRERIQGVCEMVTFNSREEEIQTALFALSPTLEISSVSDGEGTPAKSVKRYGDFLEVGLPRSMAPGTSCTLTFRYAGRLTDLKVRDYDEDSAQYRVKAELVRFPSRFITLEMNRVLPTPAGAFKGKRGEKVLRRGVRNTPYRLRIALYNGLRALSPEGDSQWETAPDGSRRSVVVSREPVSDMAIIAGPYKTLQGEWSGLPLTVYCYPRDRDMMEVALALASRQLERMLDLFGPPPLGHLTLIQTLERASGPMPMQKIPWNVVNTLRRYEVLFQAADATGYYAYQGAHDSLSNVALATYFVSRFKFAEPIGAMRQGLYLMLRTDMVRERVQPTAFHWPRVFSVQTSRHRGLKLHSDLRNYQRPFATPGLAASGNPLLPAPERHKIAEGIWRMLRHVLGNEDFEALIKELTTMRGQISAGALQETAERFYGKPLDWFFGHWFYGTGLPKYEILKAQARMVENEKTREIDYQVEIVVANRGRGLMPTPVLVQAERTLVTETLWLDSGTTGSIELLMPTRPEYVTVDPEGWVVQEAHWTEKTLTRGRPARKVEILEE